LMEAFAPQRLQIMSMHKNISQLKVKPQSRAMYLKFTSSLFAIKFAQTTDRINSETVREGMFRRRILKSFISCMSFEDSFFIRTMDAKTSASIRIFIYKAQENYEES